MSLGALIWSLVVGSFGTNLFLGNTDPLSWLPQCLLRKVFFICLTVYSQGYPEHLELVCFSSLQVSWVACHPASI